MHADIKEEWVRRLESDQYVQGECNLRFRNKHCCLGVLCEIHAEQTNTPWEDGDDVTKDHYLGEGDFLPEEVIKWAGVSGANPLIRGTSLANYNDGASSSGRKYTFREIAALIRKYL